MLRQVLANSGADKSATATIAQEWADSHSITRLWAEYETISRQANQEWYAALLDSSGLTAVQADSVRASQAWGPLMAAFRDAESRGLDVDRALPALVQGRTLENVDDIAAILHGRVNKWLQSSTRPNGADRFSRLLPEVHRHIDPDSSRALAERRSLIAQRMRMGEAAASAAPEVAGRYHEQPAQRPPDLATEPPGPLPGPGL